MSELRVSSLASTSVLAILVALGTGAVAQAADMTMPTKAYAPAPMMAPSWTGFYLGFDVGGYGNNGNVTTTGPMNTVSSYNSQEVGVGVHGGYNWQMSNFVFGVEGDYDYFPTTSGILGSDGNPTTQDRLKALASIRARFGVAIDNFLVYGTAGGAEKWSEVDAVLKPANVLFSTSANKAGAVAGGGFEYKVTKNMSVGVEGLYYFVKSTNVVNTSTGPAGAKPVAFSDNNIASVRARLSVHF